MTFEELQLAPAILEAVREQGYSAPTPIQQQAIPLVLDGCDLLAGAQTGTGKTASFMLPMLQLLSQREAKRPGAIRALVLAPTRELAAQVQESAQNYGRHLQLTSAVIFGGVGMAPQIERVQAGVDILVATPGRLLDLVGQGHIDLSAIEILVLDEADRMLDMGFIHDVKKVLALLPSERQSLLFSATFTDDIRRLASGMLHSPQSVQVAPPNTTVERIAQVIYPVGRKRKKEALVHLIVEQGWNQVLVFTRTKFGANRVADYLVEHGISAMALHGNKSQTARTQALTDFKSGGLVALVATDIAARGIDINDLPHVVNFDIPNVPEDYVHRIGRTGRAGASGQAVSLVCMDEEGFMHAIEQFTAQQIPVQPLEGFGPEEGEKAEPIAMGRQTLWGGLGKPPSREVMQAAARAARQEMMERIRESRAARRSKKGAPRPQQQQDGDNKDTRENAGERSERSDSNHTPNRANPRNRRGNRNKQRGGNGNGYGAQGGNNRRQQQHGQQPRRQPLPDTRDFGFDREDDDREPDRLPHHINPLQTSLPTRRSSAPRGPSHGAPGQPDPMRTSIDIMSGGGARKRSGRRR
ncbi:MAG: DEAD/DEAH box helicase [Rhodocyclaceae bacterium]|nr:DEAD/DEAH box helicase [Rhodocyclaceae bacterium]